MSQPTEKPICPQPGHGKKYMHGDTLLCMECGGLIPAGAPEPPRDASPQASPTLEKVEEWVKPNSDCELCKGSGFYGDNGPGRRGNAEYIRCDCTIPKAEPQGGAPGLREAARLFLEWWDDTDFRFGAGTGDDRLEAMRAALLPQAAPSSSPGRPKADTHQWWCAKFSGGLTCGCGFDARDPQTKGNRP